MSAWGYMGYKARCEAVKDGWVRGDDAPALAAIFGTTVDEILRIAELKGLIKVVNHETAGTAYDPDAVGHERVGRKIPQERSGTAREAPSTLEGRDAVPVAASDVGVQPAAPPPTPCPPGAKPLEALADGDCRFPLTHTRPFFFCASPQDEKGRPYCTAHAKRCYQNWGCHAA